MTARLSTVATVVAVFAACGLTSAPAPAQPIRPASYDREAVQVTVRWYDSKRAVVAACSRLGAWRGIDTEIIMRHPAPGCAEVRPDSCLIHALRPTRLDDPPTSTLGHELLHCFWGGYHG